jgi:hypothetical protein
VLRDHGGVLLYGDKTLLYVAAKPAARWKTKGPYRPLVSFYVNSPALTKPAEGDCPVAEYVLAILGYIATEAHRHLKEATMTKTDLMQHIRETVKEDVRLYLAPITGALNAIRKEINRPKRKTRACDSSPSGLMQHIRETVKKDVRIYLAPFTGAVNAIRKEMNRPKRKTRARVHSSPSGESGRR